jgi:4-oxalocrotonate tautomerase
MGNARGDSDMPMITIKAFRGRTLDQKRELVRRITSDVVEVFKVTPEVVSIEIVEGEPDNWARGGVLSVDRATGSPTAPNPKEAASS